MKSESGCFYKAGLFIDYAGFSDRGCVREINEDDFFVSQDHCIFAVADGVGGLSGGEIASALALESVAEFLEKRGRKKTLTSFLLKVRGQSVEKLLRGCIENANSQVYWTSREQNKKYATTIVLLAINGMRITIGHVGDSRAYRFRSNELIQLTTDHTVAQELSQSTEISIDSPYYNIITRAIGAEATLTADFIQERIHTGDTFLICSDGLTSMVAGEEIKEILVQSDCVSELGNLLVDKANSAGGKDNITVIVIRCHEKTG